MKGKATKIRLFTNKSVFNFAYAATPPPFVSGVLYFPYFIKIYRHLNETLPTLYLLCEKEPVRFWALALFLLYLHKKNEHYAKNNILFGSFHAFLVVGLL